jgi:SAM-dependent methyltransferase
MLKKIKVKIIGTIDKIITRLLSSEPVEELSIAFLQNVYSAKFKKEWSYSKEPPHFFNHRIDMVNFTFSDKNIGPYTYYRGFFASQVIKNGDKLLDIGCGDGFFTKRFFAQRCGSIDAIDIEPSAILTAQKTNFSDKIKYHLLDAVTQPFPQNMYDVVVWDGAIGHFSIDTLDIMLKKIRVALSKDGIFVGSESLGDEGNDHLSRFQELGDFKRIFIKYFPVVQLCSIEYPIGNNFLRREAYWRCSIGRDRVDNTIWNTYTG